MASAFSVMRNIRTLMLGGELRDAPLDGLRALSILWVVAFHTVYGYGILAPDASAAPIFAHRGSILFLMGYLGVDVFFALSGFLIGRLLLSEFEKTNGLNMRSFYLRRAFRILPAYYVVLALLAASLKGYHANIWANFLYVNNFLSVNDQYMSWAWSLAIEEQFYLAAPLLMLLLLRRDRKTQGRLLVGFLVFAVLLRAGIYRWANLDMNLGFALPKGDPTSVRYFDVLYGKPHTRYGGLLAGIYVAWLLRDKSFKLTSSQRGIITFASLVSLAWALVPRFIWTGAPSDPRALVTAVYITEHYAISAAAAGLILVTLAPGGATTLAHRVLSLKVFYPIAQLSYSAYLIHPLVIMGTYSGMDLKGTALRMRDFPVYAVAFAVGTLFVSAIIYVFVERPFMNMRSRFEGGQAPAPLAPATRPLS